MDMEQKYLIVLIIALMVVATLTSLFFLSDKDEEPKNPFREAIKTLDPDKKINIENAYNQSQTVHLEVVEDNTNNTVHSEKYKLDAGYSLEPAYNVSIPEDSDIKTFKLNVAVGNQTDSINMKMNQCYGNAYIEIREDGNLHVFYSIC